MVDGVRMQGIRLSLDPLRLPDPRSSGSGRAGPLADDGPRERTFKIGRLRVQGENAFDALSDVSSATLKKEIRRLRTLHHELRARGREDSPHGKDVRKDIRAIREVLESRGIDASPQALPRQGRTPMPDPSFFVRGGGG